MTFKITAIALSTVLALGFAACGQTASAQSAEDGVQVSYADLDVSTAGGAKALLHRIQHAADRYCGAQGSVPLDQRQSYDACVSDAVNTTVARLNIPTLTAMNDGQPLPSAMASAR